MNEHSLLLIGFYLISPIFTLTLWFKVKMEPFSLPITHIGRVTTTLDPNRLHKTQRELEEVIEIVRGDIDRIIEREGRLQNLTARVGDLFFRTFTDS